MNFKCLKRMILSFSLLVALFHLSSHCLEESFFKNHFSIGSSFSTFLRSHHVTMSDLNLNEPSMLVVPTMVETELALSALRGIEPEREKSPKGKGEGSKEETVEISEWNKMSKEEFLRSNSKENKNKPMKEDGRKGLPDPYYINNIKDDLRHIALYFHNDDLRNKEFIYKGQYIPQIYDDIFLIFIITLAYTYCIRNLFDGFMYGKNVAKHFIPIASTLFVFFLTLKTLLHLFPASLSAFFCLILAFQFYRVSMVKCNEIPYFKNKKLDEQPIGWLLIICFHSLIIANILYHSIFNVKVLNYLMMYINGTLTMYIFYLAALSLLSVCIFYLTTTNILPARKVQNFVFSLVSSYFLISAASYIYNFVILRYFRNTNIFQIEPMMFFSSKPKFVFNEHNTLALVTLFILVSLSLKMPKWVKKINNFFGMKKKSTERTPIGYDMLLNLWT